MVPIGLLYCKWSGERPVNGVLPLPFNLILKDVLFDELRAQEVIGTMCARAIGLPVPRVISFAELPDGSIFSPKYNMKIGSILMTRIPGHNLNEIHDLLSPDELSTIMEELEMHLNKMRRYKSPWGTRVCSTDGGYLRGPRVPGIHPTDPVTFNSAEDFVNIYIKYANPSLYCGRIPFEDAIAAVRSLNDTPHPVVFTHGDLMPQNIMVQDGHITGFVDWDYAGWLPDYWEYCEMLRIPFMEWWWPKLVVNMPGFQKYRRDLECYRSACNIASESFDYH